MSSVLPKTKEGEAPKKFGQRYPWAEWFSKDYFVLKQGTHFLDRPYTMAQQIRNAAGPKRFNLRVSVIIPEDAPDTIEVTILKRRKKLAAPKSKKPTE
jgi:hypothetical protein